MEVKGLDVVKGREERGRRPWAGDGGRREEERDASGVALKRGPSSSSPSLEQKEKEIGPGSFLLPHEAGLCPSTYLGRWHQQSKGLLSSSWSRKG